MTWEELLIQLKGATREQLKQEVVVEIWDNEGNSIINYVGRLDYDEKNHLCLNKEP